MCTRLGPCGPGIRRATPTTAGPGPVRIDALPADRDELSVRDDTLSHHGDAEVEDGLVDLAVNVRRAPMPGWLREPLEASLQDLGRYPDRARATSAVGARHCRPPTEVLLTAGAAEAFVLLARACRARFPVVVHPQFTEPEAALRAAGHRVGRVVLPEPFELDPALVPAEADLVVLGNPTNPTSALHPAEVVASLARPGRVLVVDEAFADTVPGEPESLAGCRDVPGLVVLRSFTKTWGLAGLRIGYLLAGARMVRVLAAAQPLWPVSAPALAAAEVLASGRAVAVERAVAAELGAQRRYLVDRLSAAGVRVLGRPESSFVLVSLDAADQVRLTLRERGYAVRRGDTFPGLGEQHLRIAVRDRSTTEAFVETLAGVLAEGRHDR